MINGEMLMTSTQPTSASSLLDDMSADRMNSSSIPSPVHPSQGQVDTNAATPVTTNYPLKPANESERLKILYECRLIDSSIHDAAYDRYTALASRIFKMPIVNIALVDAETVWCKSRIAPDETRRFPRSSSIVTYYLHPDSPDVVTIPDLEEDPRFKQSILFNKVMNMKFFAAAAIIVEGMKIGFLAMGDHVAHHDFNLQQRMNMLDLACAIASLISERRRLFINADAMNNLQSSITKLQQYESLPQIHELTIEKLKLIQTQLRESGIGKSQNDMDIYHNDSENEAETNEAKEIILRMSNSQQCNMFHVISVLKKELYDILPISRRNNISWVIDRINLDVGQHICYPNIIKSIILTSLCYHISCQSNIRICIGFKKFQTLSNHKRSMITDHIRPGIMHGKITVELYITKPTVRNDGTCNCADQPIPSMDRYIKQYHTINEMIQSVKGTSRYSEYCLQQSNSVFSQLSTADYRLQDLSDSSTPSSSTPSSKPSSIEEKLFQLATMDEEKCEKCYDYSIPCSIIIPSSNTKSSTLMSILSSASHTPLSRTPNEVDTFVGRKEEFGLNVLLMLSCRPIWLEDFEGLLNSMDHKLTVCDDSEIGLEYLKFNRYDIALIDITMTSLTGSSIIEMFHTWRSHSWNGASTKLNVNTLFIGINCCGVPLEGQALDDQLSWMGSYIHYYFSNPMVNMEMIRWIMITKIKHHTIDKVCQVIDDKIYHNDNAADVATSVVESTSTTSKRLNESIESIDVESSKRMRISEEDDIMS